MERRRVVRRRIEIAALTQHVRRMTVALYKSQGQYQGHLRETPGHHPRWTVDGLRFLGLSVVKEEAVTTHFQKHLETVKVIFERVKGHDQLRMRSWFPNSRG